MSATALAVLLASLAAVSAAASTRAIARLLRRTGLLRPPPVDLSGLIEELDALCPDRPAVPDHDEKDGRPADRRAA